MKERDNNVAHLLKVAADEIEFLSEKVAKLETKNTNTDTAIIKALAKVAGLDERYVTKLAASEEGLIDLCDQISNTHAVQSVSEDNDDDYYFQKTASAEEVRKNEVQTFDMWKDIDPLKEFEQKMNNEMRY